MEKVEEQESNETHRKKESTEELLEQVTGQLQRMEVECLKYYNKVRELEDEVL